MPYHMIGARNMESAILGGYVDHVMGLHPTAPLPGVYVADGIFENARQLRQRLGDEKFFEDLNRLRPGDTDTNANKPKWGKLSGWNAQRFDAAMTERPRSEGDITRSVTSSDRSQLVGALVENIFSAFRGIAQGKHEAYVDLDEGLSIISIHAQSLIWIDPWKSAVNAAEKSLPPCGKGPYRSEVSISSPWAWGDLSRRFLTN